MAFVSFEKALQQSAEYRKRHLLLGNGFSIACEPGIFNYSSLFERAKSFMSPQLIKVFELLQTSDFELVIKALQGAASILPVYVGSAEGSERMAADAIALKRALVQAVVGQHPSRPGDIDDKRYAACRRFLSNFVSEKAAGKIYRLNYDLLLYWALMHEPEGGDGLSIVHEDGFRKDPDDYEADYVIWHGESYANYQNVYYLHGAMHLFDAGAQLQKYTWINSKIPLVDQANQAIDAGLYPLFVAEGLSEQKLDKIQHSAYLHHNYKSFCTICAQGAGAALFIYGHSLAESDRHILNRIGRSKLAHLFVSIFGDPGNEANLAIVAAAHSIGALRAGGPPLKITFFEASSAQVWG